MLCMLVGYSFEPNRRALGTTGSVMTIDLSIIGCLHSKNKFDKRNGRRFPFNKNSDLKLRKFLVPILVAQTRPKPPRVLLLFLWVGYKTAVLGTTILSNGKGHSGPTDRNDQTGQSGQRSKLVPNIPVEPNRNGPFHLMYQPKFPEFWVEWKAPKKIN